MKTFVVYSAIERTSGLKQPKKLKAVVKLKGGRLSFKEALKLLVIIFPKLISKVFLHSQS